MMMRNIIMDRRVTFLGLVFSVLLAVGLVGGCGSGPEATPTPTKTPLGNTNSANTPVPAAQATTPAPQGSDQTPPVQGGSAPTATQPAAQSQSIVVINADQVNVRSEPSTTGKIVATVNTGQKFTLGGRNQDKTWLQIEDNGKEIGWVFAEYADVQTGTQPSQPTSARPGHPTTQPAATQAS